jgi:hypothetical protein
MAKLAVVKTSQNDASVNAFLDAVEGEQKRKDAEIVLSLMKKVSKQEPKMWGASIIGFGKEVVTSPTSGRSVEWFKVGFSPRKANLSIMVNNVKPHAAALKLLGKHKLGGGCIYINKLADIDIKVLEQIIKDTLKQK